MNKLTNFVLFAVLLTALYISLLFAGEGGGVVEQLQPPPLHVTIEHTEDAWVFWLQFVGICVAAIAAAFPIAIYCLRRSKS